MFQAHAESKLRLELSIYLPLAMAGRFLDIHALPVKPFLLTMRDFAPRNYGLAIGNYAITELRRSV